MSDVPDRLDSWKAIADYLGRDVRTLRRWESRGLPVRRVPGGPGNSVFAFKSEIDGWLRTNEPAPAAAPSRVVRPAWVGLPGAPVPAATSLVAPQRRRSRWPLAAASVLVVVGILGWKALAPSAEKQRLDIMINAASVIATDGSGLEKWRYDFGPGARAVPVIGQPSEVVGGDHPAVLAATAFLVQRPSEIPVSGSLRWFSIDGKLQRSFSFTDQWRFAGRTYTEPWALTDFRVDDSFGRRQVAVSAHHFTWWPGIVTILDGLFQRQGTFVNAGWVEGMRWMSPDRLAIAGFNEALDGGMFGVLDTHDIDGASPEAPGSRFACDNCRAARPLVYAVFPRSELNRVSGSPFNRASLEMGTDGISVHTSELERAENAGVTEAIYEFSRSFELVAATYSSRYWDAHRAAELQGKIAHTRENCPEREGPPFIKVWTRDTGWRDVKPKR